MAKVIFLQQLAEEWLGVMYISSLLKKHGHQCDIFVEPLEESDIAMKAIAEKPDIIAFSCLTSDFYWALKKAETIKKHSKALVIMGGTHVTLNPTGVISNPQVDIICRGEGEYPMLELANSVDRDSDFSSISNLWVKKNGKLKKNEMRKLIQNLDSLPFPDRDLYAKYDFFRRRGKRPLHFGRGCPYNCSYCHNASKRALLPKNEKYVRWRSMPNILKEVEHIWEKSYVKVFHFIDDSFGINREWLKAFLTKISGEYEKKITIQANMRADMITEDLCESLKAYGSRYLRLRIAVECGDESYRREILKKNISNEVLLRASKLLHKYRINFITYSMIGLPGEDLTQALKTLRFNLKLKPRLAISFIYQPYQGTELANYGIKNGYLNQEAMEKLGSQGYEGFYHSRSVLIQKDIDKVENLCKIFSLVVEYPFLYPLVKLLVSSQKMSPFLLFLYKLSIRKILFMRKLRDKY